MSLNKDVKRELTRMRKHRVFPLNTCAASRHMEIIGETLGMKKPYAMIAEEPEHVAVSILSVVASLYKARTEIYSLKAKIARARTALSTVGHRT